jgi:hypothetical protein
VVALGDEGGMTSKREKDKVAGRGPLLSHEMIKIERMLIYLSLLALLLPFGSHGA